VFDTNNDGFLDYHELKVAMRALGFDIPKAETLQIIKDHDRQGRRLISFDDFSQVSMLFVIQWLLFLVVLNFSVC
jgi:centrin-3